MIFFCVFFCVSIYYVKYRWQICNNSLHRNKHYTAQQWVMCCTLLGVSMVFVLIARKGGVT